ncbi:kinase [Obelidium mucronatum]|nr:kinase [Obelidium mucronatum]
MIGQGSFGKVYFGVNLSTQELMAVKQVQLVPLKVGAGPALVNRNRKLLDALNVEISLLRELQHPNVVNYLGFDVHENLVSVFLEYVDGGSLASILSRFGKFEYEMAQSFTCQILCGLEYLHDRCIIHRDIKGANILVNHLGVVKIADFGISKKNEYKYQPNARLSLQGTVYWMAPEIMLNQGGAGGGGVGYNSKVDIWSLGCVVYEMLEGHHPWTGFNEMQIMWKVGKEHRAPELTDELSDDVKLFLKLCFAFEPENRPSARELLSSNFANVEPLDFNFEFWLKTAQARRDSMDDNNDDDDDMFSSDCDSE